ncbi:MAG: PAS domain S-box protein [Candidatus Hodarchaeales archaeon]
MHLETILERPDVPLDVREAIKSYLIEQRQIKEAQHEIELHLRQIFNSMGDAIHVVGSDLRFVLFNAAFKQWNKELGLKEDVLGQRISEVFPFLSDRIIDEYNQVFSTGEPLVTEESTKIGDEEFITETRKIPIFDEGKVTRVVTVVRNITEYKQAMMSLQESEEKYRNLVERANDGIAIVQDSLIKYANSMVTEITGYSAKDLHDTPIINYIHPEVRSKVIKRYEQRMAGQSVPPIYETKLLLKNGRTLEVEINAGVITHQGKPADLAIVRDISERKQIERALRESETRYRTILENIEDGYYEVDLTGNLTFFNDAMCRIHGYSKEEMMGMNNREYTDEKTAERVYDNFNKVYRTGEPARIFAYEIIRKDGTRRVNEASVSLITNSDGESIGFRGIVRDTTEHQQAEQALRESEEKYRTILETIEEGYYEVDLAGNFIFFNDSICGILGYSKDELMGMNYHQYTNEETAEMVYQTYNTVFQTGEPAKLFDFEVIRKNGSRMFNEVSVSLIVDIGGKSTGFRGIVRDITDRKEMETALGEEREKYETLVNKLEEGVTLEDPEGIITYANPKTLEILGYTDEELIGKHWSFIVPEKNIEESHIETEKRSRGISSTYESGILAKDGTNIPVIVSATPIFSNTGEFQSVLVLSTDITERKRIEEELQQSEEKYSNLFHQSNDAIFLHDLDGSIIDVNEKTLKMFGYTQPEILSFKIPSLHPPEMSEASRNAFERITEEGFVNFEIDFKKKNGEVFPTDVSSSLFTIGGKQVIQGIVRDITKRKQAEQALRQVKLEEERYHAMLSHFINNDMQKIISNLELLSLMYESELKLDDNILRKIVSVASGSSKTIDTVNKIFEVLQSPFIPPKDSTKLLDVINEAISVTTTFSQYIKFDKENLEVMIFSDAHLKDVFSEIFIFILSSDVISIKTRIDIRGSFIPSFFCVIISDCCSKPLPQELISKLSGKITDEWEVIGHNIGLALASVIVNYYGGSLEIHPSDHKGNEFKLLFPLNLIKASGEIKGE